MSVAKLKVVCVGFNRESEIALLELIRRGVNIVSVITLPSKEEAKGSDYVRLHDVSELSSLDFFHTDDINNNRTVAHIQALKPDLMFVLGWNQLIKRSVIEIPKIMAIGSHPSNLPYGAGRAPIPWTILEGLKQSALTLFVLESVADAGDVLLQSEFSISESIYAGELYDVVSQKLAESFVEIYFKISCNEVVERIKQDSALRTVRAKRVPDDGFIDFNTQTSDQVYRLVRAVSQPYPGAFSYYQNKKIVIWRALPEPSNFHKGMPGQVLRKRAGRILVQCMDSAIWLYNIEYESQHSVFDIGIGDRIGQNVNIEIQILKDRIKKLEGLLAEHGIIK